MIYSHKKTKIVFSNNIFREINEFIKRINDKIFVLTDSNTIKKCLPLIKDALENKIHVFEISAGESHKNIDSIIKIWDFLNENGADRKSTLLNLGGGVLCDMGGFAASTFKRGINFVHVPTTLLSQVDASVGGKTGFNFNNYKNEIGSFAFPSNVIIHTGFLKTLTKEHILSGYAEMIKHALINSKDYYADLQNFNVLKNFDSDLMLDLIKRSIDIKKAIVMADPNEQSVRKILNFGHTVGHALESYFIGSEKKLLHGQAIAYGIIIELYLSNMKLNFSINKLHKISAFINNLYGKFIFDKADYNRLHEIMTHDKKNENGLINCTLLRDIGDAYINQTVTHKEINMAFDLYLS